MSRKWYYRRGSQEVGPITSSELKAAAVSGRLRPDDIVRANDMTKWIPASKVQGLFDPQSSAELTRPQPPPLPPRVKSGPPPLPAKRNPSLPVAQPVVPLNAIRDRLTTYAQAVPHHGLKDFGAEIKVTQTAVQTVYRMEWTTLFEQREVVERERPHDGGTISTVASVMADEYDPWTENLPPTKFAADTKEVAIPGSESARDCTACGSSGELGCPSCGGQADALCPACDGNGIVRCSGCLGLRRVENKVPQSGQRACHCVTGGYCPDPNVNGGCHRCRNTGVETYTYYASEWVQCLACQATGHRTCSGCQGHGRVACPTCDGHGIVGCGTCGGSGSVIRSLAVVQTLEPHKLSARTRPGDCPAEAAKLLDFDDDFQKRFARTVIGASVSIDDWSLPPNAVAEIEKLRSEAASKTTPTQRSAGERIRVFTATVYRLEYTFEGERYTAWFPGDDRPVYAPVSPLTERAMQLVDDALAAWEEGDQRTAYRSLRMALDMGKKCDHCRSVVKRRRSAIPDGLLDEAEKFDLMHWLGGLFR